METIPKQKLSKPSKLFLVGKWLRRHPTTFIGIAIVLFFLLLAVIGPYIAPYSFSAQSLGEKLQPPSEKHFFGTDQFGRDIYSRILVGSRDVFMVAGLGTVLAVFLGLLVGLFSGYRGGMIDEIVMRCMDVILSIPALLLAMVILFSLGPSRVNVILVVGFLYIPMVARVVRSVVLDLKTRQFIEAAKLRGESSAYILFKEILPNVLPYLAVEASMRFSYAIFLVASLGFLGLGVQPPRPDWGLMVGEARQWFHQARWVLYFPAGTIALLVVGVGFMSDGLRNMLLPGGVSDD
ncbi:ABC transporter permease [Candidatus Formimonas warabiya]|uniref:ABC transporter permease n=2 Tax=Formimonas warabiya TaxID=1761012 RepID=A0A3G1L2N9_FORW1|nr:ABC transporter permease [Candidatus Formimonas warabiya]ATW28927.1 ABC transporter permease [Candidatus Formimonas warabiya]